MEGDKFQRVQDGDPLLESVDFRHLSAFQEVYQARSYSHDGQGSTANRKSVIRMIRNLERGFGCVLFKEGLQGELAPSAFAERLFNDLRFLNVARQRMLDHIAAVHANGRVLHIGCSTAVFRTREFRKLFRALQAFDGIRASYTPIDSTDAGKALVSGHCDLYIGCWTCTSNRYAIQSAGSVSFRLYRRGTRDESARPAATRYVVGFDTRSPDLGTVSGSNGEWQPLDESQWLHWLDHPEECPPGTMVLMPDVQINSDSWQLVEEPGMLEMRESIHFGYLRHHAYEFLPALVGKIRNTLKIP